MAMLCVVPMDEARHPGARGIDAGEAMRRPGDLYLQFRNSASETGLSSDTRGWLNEATTPRRSMVTFMVAAFMGLPLSACRTSGLVATPFRPQGALRTYAANSAVS